MITSRLNIRFKLLLGVAFVIVLLLYLYGSTGDYSTIPRLLDESIATTFGNNKAPSPSPSSAPISPSTPLDNLSGESELVEPEPENPAFAHLVSYSIPRSDISHRQCDAISAALIHDLALAANLKHFSNPIIHHFHDGQAILDSTEHSFPAGTEFCSVIYAPQSPRTNESDFQNMPIWGWGPDSIHAEIASQDIRLVFEHPDFWGFAKVTPDKGSKYAPVDFAVYTVGYALNHPGSYQVVGEVDLQNYDWVMEDPIDLHEQNLPYSMLENQLSPRSPSIIITGSPISRPIQPCHRAGYNDMRGRWYRAEAFSSSGSQTALNPAAHLEFADHNTTVDEWGWTFAPDTCSLRYFSPGDHLDCLADRTIQVLGDSNSRRVLKSIMAGGIAWCQDPNDRLCQCEDQFESDMMDVLFNKINVSRFRDAQSRDDPTQFGRNSNIYLDFIGGLLNQVIWNGWFAFYDKPNGEQSVLERRFENHGPIDVVHLSMVGWDVAAIRTPSEILASLPEFRKIFLSAYPPGTRFLTRLANSLCCGNNNHRTRYSGPRFRIFNDMWRGFWQSDENAGLMTVVDTSALQGRRDAEIRFYCPTTHLRASHIRIEQMAWLGAVCEREDVRSEEEKAATATTDSGTDNMGPKEAMREGIAQVASKPLVQGTGPYRMRDWPALYVASADEVESSGRGIL